MYSHLLFDLDGTLIDSKRGIFNAVHYTLDSMGIPRENRPADLNPFIGPPLRESFRNLFNFSTDVAEAATIKYREYYGEKGLFEFDIFQGIPEVIKKLADKGFKLCVVTSKAELYAKLIIESTPFGKYFQTTSGCEIDGRRSTKQELISYTLEKLNIQPSKKILMIGDRYHDIRGAKETGISSAAILYGYGSREELTEESPDIFIETTEGLLSIPTLTDIT